MLQHDGSDLAAAAMTVIEIPPMYYRVYLLPYVVSGCSVIYICDRLGRKPTITADIIRNVHDMVEVTLIPIDWSEYAEKAFNCKYL